MDKGPRPPGWSNVDAACFNAGTGCYAAGIFVMGLFFSVIAALVFAVISGEEAAYTVFGLGAVITIIVTWLSWHTGPKVK